MPEAPLVHALGFSPWKRPLVRQFLHGHQVKFVRHPRQVPEGATLAVWASGPHRECLAHKPAIKRLLLEDGFLRSVGLGAYLIKPLSWVVDTRGIYYDATRPSDLELHLETARFDEEILSRARTLRSTLLESGLTKYNVGTSMWPGVSPKAAGRGEIVLVPGQVETDASIRQGTPGIRTNIELLRAAREMHPKSWLIYKPHPDVVAGLRDRGAGEERANRWCDEVVTNAPMGRLLQSVDTVHVMTSLTGFEALMRSKRVVCHGLPFYSGWGLTRDIWPASRRTRQLRLDELIAGALIQYPTYISLATMRPCTVEQTVTELIELRSNRKGQMQWWRRAMLPFLHRR